MSKKTIALLTLLAVLCFGCFVTAQAATHTHTFTTTTTQVPTCVKDGTQVKRCTSCGYTTTVNMGKASHVYSVFVSRTDATCVATGKEVVACKVCGVKKTTTLAKNPNNHKRTASSAMSATCTTAGSSVTICSDCGKTLSSSTTKALGHNYQVTGIICGNCKTGTKTVYACTRCRAQKTVYSAVDPNNHASVTRQRTAATCTKDGKIVETCGDCGKVLSTTVLKATGHDKAGSAVTKAPTCTAAGYNKIYCSKCGVVSYNQTIAAKGHSMKSVALIAPTCKSTGKVTLKCQNAGCSYTTTATIPVASSSHASVVRRNGKNYCGDCGVCLN